MDVTVVYGPPGTGKTTKLMEILEGELNKVAPSEIAYCSFTREGAEQGKARAMERFGFTDEDFPYFRTLHSLAYHALGMRRSSVIDRGDYKKFSDKMGMRFTGYYTEEFRNDDDKYLFFDELYRNNARAASTYLSMIDVKKLRYVQENYRKFKDLFAIFDFTDMIEMFNERNSALPVKVAFIDEAQDLTTLQWKMVWTAFKDCERVYIAGDDDQAIYQWSGADVDYFLGLRANSIVLRHSFRLPDSVLSVAKRITSQMSKRVEKEYEGRGAKGAVVYHNSLETIPVDDASETYMFLSRNHAFLTDVETELRRRALIYTLSGEPSVTKDELALIRLYEKARGTLQMAPSEEAKLTPHLKGKYKLTDPWYESFSWTEEKKMYVRDIVRTKADITRRNVRASTIHSVKGAEADNVVLLLDITRNVANNLAMNPDSEHRAFYVGATRARKTLHIVYPRSKNGYKLY